MAKFSNDLNMDELLARLKANVKLIVLCQGQPVSFNEAITDLGSSVAGGCSTCGRALGETTLSTADFTGPADGDANGRKLTINQVTGLAVDVTSTNAAHVALVTTTTATELMVVTTITTPQPVTSGNTATINAFDYEVADVT
jgi:hypothetical protein